MKKLLTLIVIMLLTVSYLAVARSGDQYQLLNVLSFENYLRVTVTDYSNIDDKELYGDDLWTSSVAVFNQNKVKGSFSIPINDLITFKPDFENRITTDGNSTGSSLESINWMERIKFGARFDIGKIYSLRINSESDLKFTIGTFNNVIQKIFLDNRIFFSVFEIDADLGYYITWKDNNPEDDQNVDLQLELEFIFKTKDFEKWADEVEKWRKKRAPWAVGPVGIGLYVEQQFNLYYNPENWKDTTPGKGRENSHFDASSNYQADTTYVGYAGEEGVFEKMKSATTLEFAIDVLKSNEKIGLVIALSETFTANVPYSWNKEETKDFSTDTVAGVSLFLDVMVFGLYARVKTTDYYNADSPEAGGVFEDDGNDEQDRADWWNTTAEEIDGVEYAAHPQHRGTVGPVIYVGFNKDWFEWKLMWTGATNFRRYDANRDNYTSTWGSNMSLQSSWINTLEASMRIKW